MTSLQDHPVLVECRRLARLSDAQPVPAGIDNWRAGDGPAPPHACYELAKKLQEMSPDYVAKFLRFFDPH